MFNQLLFFLPLKCHFHKIGYVDLSRITENLRQKGSLEAVPNIVCQEEDLM